jgi:hypothetical protein
VATRKKVLLKVIILGDSGECRADVDREFRRTASKEKKRDFFFGSCFFAFAQVSARRR